MRIIQKGATSQTLYVEVLDSASTTGGRKTGIAFNTASLVGSYVRNGAARTAITLATQTAAGAWSSGGFVEVDATNVPGIYRFDVPDAAFASGADSVVVTLKGASGMVQVSEEVQLTAVNFQDAVRAGMTALPNANAEAAGGLYTRGTGAGQINQANNGNVDVNAVRINAVATTSVTTINANIGATQPINFTGTAASALVKSDAIDLAGTALTGRDIGASVLLSAGTGTGQLDFTSGVVKANLAQILGTALTETAGQIAAGFKQFFNIGSPTSTMNLVTTVGSVTGSVASVTGAVGSVTGAVGSVTGNVGGNVTGSVGSVVGAVGSVTGNVGGNVVGSVASVTGAVGSVTGSVGGNVTGSVGSVATDGISAASIAANAIGASELATDAVTEIVNGVWNELESGHTTAGTFGRFLDAQVSLVSGGGGGTAPTSADNAAAVWNAVATSFNTAGTMGQKLNAAGGAADPLLNTVPGSYAANTAGYALGTLPSGVGPIRYVYTVHSGSDAGPLIGAGVSVWVTSDLAGTVVIAGPLITNDLSQVTFFLNAATVYFWRQRAGWSFVNPDQEVVS